MVGVVGARAGAGRGLRALQPRRRGSVVMLLLLLLLGGFSVFVSADADAIRGARCVLACAGSHDDCADSCLWRRSESKPGLCPAASALTVFEAACITACTGDGDCPATDKCCAHACGVTCQPAHGLASVPGLPEIPGNVTASERGHSRPVVTVAWSSADAGAADLLFVLEERHHVGKRLSPKRLGPWAALHRGAETHCVLPQGTLRPGRWYEFRVAAVSANGSRGFSEPSQPFKLSAPPRPPKMPQRLEVGPLELNNGSMSGLLSWQAADSDLPVQRYKVFWSRRLEASSTAGSVLVNHHTVPWDVTSFKLQDLQPRSQYFLQVQALSQYGNERLKSEKAAIFLDTARHQAG